MTASSALAHYDGDQLKVDPSLMAGLPLDSLGYTAGRLKLSGTWPDSVELERDVATRRSPGGPVNEDHKFTYYRYREAAWEVSDSPASDRAFLESLPRTLCDVHGKGLHFEPDDASKTRDSAQLVVGHCQDGSKLRPTPTVVLIARRFADNGAWESFEAPSGTETLFWARSGSEAYLPVETKGGDVELGRFNGNGWTTEPSPLKPRVDRIVGREDGTLWVVADGAVWSRTPDGEWKNEPLPHVERVDSIAAYDAWVIGGELWVLAGTQGGAIQDVLLRTSPTAPSFGCLEGVDTMRAILPEAAFMRAIGVR